jgi:hypothetical protein
MKKAYNCQFVVMGSDGFRYIIDGFYNEANSDILDRAYRFYNVKMSYVIFGDVI